MRQESKMLIEVRSALSLQKNVFYEMQFIVISAKQKQGAMLLRLPSIIPLQQFGYGTIPTA